MHHYDKVRHGEVAGDSRRDFSFGCDQIINRVGWIGGYALRLVLSSQAAVLQYQIVEAQFISRILYSDVSFPPAAAQRCFTFCAPLSPTAVWRHTTPASL